MGQATTLAGTARLDAQLAGGAVSAASPTPTQVAVTDSSGGTASTTIKLDAAQSMVALPIPDMVQFADGDIVTAFVPGFAGKILKAFWIQEDPVTTGAKLSTLNLEIGSTNVTGGVISLTSAACTPLGKYIAGTEITADNVFAADDTISVEASSTTAFVEGSGTIILVLAATDVNDNFATVARDIAAIKVDIAALVTALETADICDA